MIYALVVLCAILAALFLKKEAEGKYVPAVILKGLASLCFVAVGAFCSPWNQVATLIVAGLIIGSTADVLLNLRMVFEKKGQAIFLVGILVFLTGHILYLAAILPLCSYKAACIIIGIILKVTGVMKDEEVKKFTHVVFVTLYPFIMFDNLYGKNIADNMDVKLGLYAVGFKRYCRRAYSFMSVLCI